MRHEESHDCHLPWLHRPGAQRREAAAGPVSDRGLPGPVGRPDAAGRPGPVGVRHHHRVRAAARLELVPVPGAADPGRHGRPALRDEVVQARHGVARGQPRHAARRGRERGRLRAGRTATAGTPRTCRWRTSPTGRRGSPTSTTVRRWPRSTAARPGCSYPTCTCGRAPSGYAASSCCCRTSRASGRPPDTTTTVTRGASSGTGATDLAGRHRGGDPAGDRRPRAPWCWRCPTGPATWPASTSTSG